MSLAAGIQPETLTAFIALVREHTGIAMSERKSILLERRLRPRMQALEIGSYQDYLDKVVRDRVEVPQLTLAWPTVAAWHPDEPALNLLSEVLSANRAAVLDKALCVDEELAGAVSISHRALEVDGQLVLSVRPRPAVSVTVKISVSPSSTASRRSSSGSPIARALM